jgi:hypothetical protein
MRSVELRTSSIAASARDQVAEMSALESALALSVSCVLRPLPSSLCRDWRVRLRDHRR